MTAPEPVGAPCRRVGRRLQLEDLLLRQSSAHADLRLQIQHARKSGHILCSGRLVRIHTLMSPPTDRL